MIDRGAVSAALQIMIAQATGRPCGLGNVPVVDGKPATVPYTVLYPLGGQVGGALLGDMSEDAVLVYQLTSVGGRTDQAEWMADHGQRAVLERTASGVRRYPLDVTGVDVWARELDSDDGIDTSAEGVVTSSQRYRFSATSST